VIHSGSVATSTHQRNWSEFVDSFPCCMAKYCDVIFQASYREEIYQMSGLIRLGGSRQKIGMASGFDYLLEGVIKQGNLCGPCLVPATRDTERAVPGSLRAVPFGSRPPDNGRCKSPDIEPDPPGCSAALSYPVAAWCPLNQRMM
jgi:hypothetical protein